MSDTRQTLTESGIDTSHIIEISPDTDRRVTATRRMSDRDKLARLELDLEWATARILALETLLGFRREP